MVVVVLKAILRVGSFGVTSRFIQIYGFAEGLKKYDTVGTVTED